MNEDFSEVIDKFKNILNEKNIDLSQFASINSNNNIYTSNNTTDTTNNKGNNTYNLNNNINDSDNIDNNYYINNTSKIDNDVKNYNNNNFDNKNNNINSNNSSSKKNHNITNNNSNNSNTSNTTNSFNTNPFNIDIGTILKIKDLITSAQNKNSSRLKLLEALKPFLKQDMQQKLDEYIKIANILTILEVFNEKRN